jgi:hypothetical protein
MDIKEIINDIEKGFFYDYLYFFDQKAINNNQNCEFFNYNNHYTSNYVVPENKVYSFDSNYCRNIGISGPYEGSMPFNPTKIN